MQPFLCLISIGVFVDVLDRTAAGVVHVAEGFVPFEGDGGGTGHAGLAGDAEGGAVAGEMLGKDAAVVVFLLVLGRMDGEPLGGMGHLLVADGLGGQAL